MTCFPPFFPQVFANITNFKNGQVPLPHSAQRIFSSLFQEAIAILQSLFVHEIGYFPHMEPENYRDCFL
jgi:hypothetical protein